MPIIYEPKGRAREYSYLACNLYEGCVHGCKYCYVPDILRRERSDFHLSVKPRTNILREISKDLAKIKDTYKRVLLCFTCDPYPPAKYEKGLTRQALELFRRHNVPFQILTKGGTRACRDFDLYGSDDAFATTLTYTLDDGKSLEIEPGAAIPSDRIMAIRIAKERGITTWVSLEPVIDPGESLRLIEETHDFVDLYKIGKLNHIPNSIDWRKFGSEAIDLCRKYKVPFYIKADLAAYLGGIDFTNTETRLI